MPVPPAPAPQTGGEPGKSSADTTATVSATVGRVPSADSPLKAPPEVPQAPMTGSAPEPDVAATGALPDRPNEETVLPSSRQATRESPPAVDGARSAAVPPVVRPKPAGAAGRSVQKSAVPAGSSPPAPAPALAEPDVGALSLRMAPVMLPGSESKVPRPVFLSAQRISGVVDREVMAEEDAELRKAGTVLTADRLTYWPVDDEVEAVGKVRVEQGEDVISGLQGRLKIEDQVGSFDQASYFVKRQSAPAVAAQGGKQPDLPWAEGQDESTTGFAAPRVLGIKPGQTRLKSSTKPANELTEARGEAERIDLDGENQYRLTSATYTTCKPGNDDWYLSFSRLKLDYDHEEGTGDDATVHFLGVPILHSPWASFSLNNERKSGFLIPRYGSSSDSGLEFVVPYYWNIAPNMDATLESRILSKRGLQLGSQFRYLNTAYGGTYRGETFGEYLPNDRKTNTDRWGVVFNHSQTQANGFSGTINYSKVSDNDYYTDLSSQITSTSKTQLLQQGVLSYGGGGWWNATANLQSFQTLQPDPKNPVARPYRLLPQITMNARQPDLFSSDSAFFGQYTAFVHPDADKVEGQRIVLQPEVSLPYVTPGWYVVPRIGVNFTQYSLSYPTSANVLPTSISRTLPIVSVDSGMTFERSSNWFGRDYTQTLEPRLFYLSIPYRNQNNIPVFDTALADFNFAQIFADNQFSGWDRINNANQLTAAVASRLIDPSSGSEIMRAMVGEVFYFADNRVVLPGTQTGTTDRKWDKSDLLAAFSGQLLPRLYADAAVQFDINDQRFQRYSFGTRYLPGPGKVLNAGYRYNVDAATPIKEFDISGQWPINARWQAVGRYNYSLINSTPVEIIGGLEYNAGCWVLRTVVHRIQTTQADSSTQFFVQLDLTGLSSIGTNPLTVLQRRIPGYAVGQAATDQALAE